MAFLLPLCFASLSSLIQRRNSSACGQPVAKRQRPISGISGKQCGSRSTADNMPSWQEVCQSFASCKLSWLSGPGDTTPQQLLLTQKGVTVVVVDRPAQTAKAVAILRASMQDSLLGLGIDYEARFHQTFTEPCQPDTACQCHVCPSCACLLHGLQAVARGFASSQVSLECKPTHLSKKQDAPTETVLASPSKSDR